MTQIAHPSLRFFIVQDSTLSAIELECRLEDLGHKVEEVAVAPDVALAKLRETADRVDAVIFDCLQLGLPAYEMAREAERLGVPAVVTSHFPESFVRVLGFAQPAVSKPYRDDTVAAALCGVAPRAEAGVAA